MNDATELERQVRDLAECVLVSSDKLEQTLRDINTTLRLITRALIEISEVIRQHGEDD
jgi:hypothetical protein